MYQNTKYILELRLNSEHLVVYCRLIIFLWHIKTFAQALIRVFLGRSEVQFCTCAPLFIYNSGSIYIFQYQFRFNIDKVLFIFAGVLEIQDPASIPE